MFFAGASLSLCHVSVQAQPLLGWGLFPRTLLGQRPLDPEHGLQLGRGQWKLGMLAPHFADEETAA